MSIYKKFFALVYSCKTTYLYLRIIHVMSKNIEINYSFDFAIKLLLFNENYFLNVYYFESYSSMLIVFQTIIFKHLTSRFRTFIKCIQKKKKHILFLKYFKTDFLVNGNRIFMNLSTII